MNFYNEQYALLEEELSLFAELGILPVKKLNGALACVTKALENLKAYILSHPFTSADEEIYFLKYEKPRFFANEIFLMEQFTVENQKPLNSELQQTYYQDELKFVQRFFGQYKFQYGFVSD